MFKRTNKRIAMTEEAVSTWCITKRNIKYNECSLMKYHSFLWDLKLYMQEQREGQLPTQSTRYSPAEKTTYTIDQNVFLHINTVSISFCLFSSVYDLTSHRNLGARSLTLDIVHSSSLIMTNPCIFKSSSTSQLAFLQKFQSLSSLDTSQHEAEDDDCWYTVFVD